MVAARAVSACLPAPSLLPQLPLGGGMGWADTAAPLPARVSAAGGEGLGNDVEKAQLEGHREVQRAQTKLP